MTVTWQLNKKSNTLALNAKRVQAQESRVKIKMVKSRAELDFFWPGALYNMLGAHMEKKELVELDFFSEIAIPGALI
jgi:hypothetical protein